MITINKAKEIAKYVLDFANSRFEDMSASESTPAPPELHACCALVFALFPSTAYDSDPWLMPSKYMLAETRAHDTRK